jgi:phosphoribosylamine--glycine ligase
VVKADGLAAGKGTIVAATAEEARAAIAQIMGERRFGTAGARVVIEEALAGEEVSFLVLCDGTRVVPLASVQDHKRIHDGEQGPNTGGMGTISPATVLTLDLHKRIMQEVVVPVVKGMAAEGRRFQGVLYAGVMITDKGPKVLEFNARFGDPEAQVIFARLRSDIVPVLQGAAAGQLADVRLEWAREPAVCVVMASAGYPDTPQSGQPIEGIEAAAALPDVTVFHSGTALADGKVVTAGGRVLSITALGSNLEAAVQRAYEAVDKVRFDGMQVRRDIGQKALAKLQGPRA